MGLLDELGQVSHIFSDKTGTLTSNLMAFRRLYIGGVQYGIGETAISRALKDAPADDAPPPPRPPPEGGRFGCRPQNQRYVDYEEAAGAPSLFDVLTSAGGAGACAARELIVAMAVNHSVLIESVDGVEELSASSPDEQARPHMHAPTYAEAVPPLTRARCHRRRSSPPPSTSGTSSPSATWTRGSSGCARSAAAATISCTRCAEIAISVGPCEIVL